MKTSSFPASAIDPVLCLKDDGNVAFRNGDFSSAVSHYESALRVLREGNETGEVKVQVDLLNNLALALLRVGRGSDAIHACKQVLAVDPNNFKATWRWAVALEEDCRFAAAVDVLEKLQSMSACLDESARKRMSRKLQVLRRNADGYEAPKLADCERQSWLNKQQRLRLSVKGNPFPGDLVAGETVIIHAEFYVSNEFGLFDHAALASSPKVVCRGIFCDTRREEAGGLEVSLRGDSSVVTGKAALSVCVSPAKAAATRSFVLRFGCETSTEVRVLPVLSLPIRVVAAMDQTQGSAVEVEGALEASCCREISLDVDLERRLLVLEAQGHLGIAGKLWDSALVLIDYIKRHPFILEERIIELGAGTGAVGLACAAISGRRQVTLTDLAHVVPLMEANARLNSFELGGKVNVAVCEWGSTKLVDKFDMVVMSDVVYHPAGYLPLIHTLEQVSLKAGGGCRILWSHRHRNPNDHQFFGEFHQRFVTYKLDGPGPKFIEQQEARLVQAFNTPHPDNSEKPDKSMSRMNHSSSDVSIYLSTLRPSEMS